MREYPPRGWVSVVSCIEHERVVTPARQVVVLVVHGVGDHTSVDILYEAQIGIAIAPAVGPSSWPGDSMNVQVRSSSDISAEGSEETSRWKATFHRETISFFPLLDGTHASQHALKICTPDLEALIIPVVWSRVRMRAEQVTKDGQPTLLPEFVDLI